MDAEAIDVAAEADVKRVPTLGGSREMEPVDERLGAHGHAVAAAA